MIRTNLKKMGLKENEIEVYLKLLEMGTQPSSQIAKQLNIPKSSIFDILSGLEKMGIVSRHVRQKVHYFSVPSPKALISYLERKENEIKIKKNDIKNSLPDLFALMNPYAIRPKVETYEGWEGIKAVLDDTLDSKTMILAYVYVDGWVMNKDLYEYARENNRIRCEKGIFERGLVGKTTLAEKYYNTYSGTAESNEFRWLSNPKYQIQNEISIYEDKVSIASINVEDQLGIIITSKKIADTQRAIFETAWKGAEKFKKVNIKHSLKIIPRSKLINER